MATFTPAAVVNEITGRAWIRNSDGSLTELHQGSKVPAGSDIVTASGATVSLQVENGMPIVIGESRDVAINGDMAGPLADPSEAAVAPPTGTDSDRLLAALQAGRDPFDELDPTAAIVAGGGDAGGSSFVRLARILETTTPLDLAYTNPGQGDDTVPRASSAGLTGDNTGDAAVPAATNTAPLAANDISSGDQNAVQRGNLLTNDTDPDGDPLTLVSVSGRPMTSAGVTVTGSNGGTFTVLPDGSYVFTPGTGFTHLPAGQTETTTISYTVTDPSGATSTATVEVTIVGVNDPAQITPANSGDDAGTVKEDTTFTTNGKLNVTDVDDGEARFVVQSGHAGQHGTFSIDASGAWVYNLNNNDARVQALAVGETLTETFTVTTADGTTGTVTVTIQGTNDVPTLSGQAAGAVTEDTLLAATGKLTVTDVDTSDTHTWSVNNSGTGQYGALTIAADGTWTYNLTNTNPAVQALGVGESLTETFTVTVNDGHGGVTTQNVTITINGTNDAPVITGAATGTVADGGATNVSGQLSQTDVDTNDTHTWTVNNGGKGDYGNFTVDNSGKWTYQLDDTNTTVKGLKSGESITETFTVSVDDGHGGVTTQQVTVTINGTDDGAVVTPSKPGDDLGTVTEDSVLTTGGKLDVTDPDAGQAAFNVVNDQAGDHGKFSIDANGNWTYSLNNADTKVQALAVGETLTEKFTVTTVDGTKAEIVVTINGTNDDPKLSGELTGTVTEDGVKTANGQLSVSDVDTSDTHSYAVVSASTGTYGSFAVDSNGKWTYTLDNDAAQALKSGDVRTETYTVQVSDGHGGVDTKTVTVTINGVDDGAVITPSKPGDDLGSVTEDSVLTTGGKLDVTDPDAGQAKFNTVTDQSGDHGKFSIDANGNWTYSLNNADSKVQALAVGETLTEKFTVTTIDGTKAEIVVTINGTNDDPKLSGELTGTVTEDGVKTANGQLSVADVDASDTHTYSVVGAATGTYGSFAVDANGKWTYTLDNDAAQALKSGDVKTETYTVQVSDGHGGFDTKTVTVTINGADDGAVVTPSKPGDDAGSVTEDTLLTTGGKLDVTDPDAGQAKFNTVTDQAGDHGKFSIDANGNWTYSLNNADTKVQALAVGETLTEKFTVTTIDGTKAEIVVTINGTNDDPKLSGELTGTVTEDGTKTANGQLNVSDVDASDTHTYSVVGASTGTYGSFSVDNNGKWTYTLNNDAAQALKSGDVKTETYTVQVSDGHGGFDTKTVTVTINGADDGAIVTPSKPGDDLGSVTEDSILTTGGKLDVTDPDAGQAKFNTVTDQAGDHGKFSIDANGNWTYSLNNADTKVQALAVGETLTEKFTVTTIDGTKAEIVVTINGTNDDPKLSGELTGTVTEDGVKTANGQLSVADVDASDTHTYSVVGPATGTYGSFAVDANGKWTYTLDNDAAQALKSGDVKTETYTVQVSDGHGGFDTKTVTVTINGADDGAVVTPSKPGDDLGSVTEDTLLTTGGKLDVTDPDAGQAKFNTVTDQAGDHGKFSIDANGNWTYSLNNADTKVQALAVGETLTEKFTVTTIDGTKAEIVVTINGTNDDPKLSGELTGTVTEDGVKTANGQLSVADVDASDTHTYSVVGPATGTYGSFAVDANGKWTYTLDNDAAQALKSGDVKTETYTVQVSDGHGGFDTKTVTVTINGADDGAVVTPSKPGDDLGSVTEDSVLTTGGKLDVTDPDAGQAKFNTVTDQAGDHGKFSIDANGNWTYSLNNADSKVQALAVGETLTEKFTVTTIDGTKAEIVVTINGTNDDPKLSGELTGTVTEDGVKTANGQLSVADVDASDTHTYSVVGASTGTYGSFAVDANGKWTYTLNNDAAQALKSGDIKTETYTVQVSDGHGGFDTKTVTVTINGADDGAIVTPSKPGDDLGSVTEDSILTTGGKLDVTDPDAGQAKFNTVTDQAGDHGKFSIDATGNWTYSLNNADSKVQALAVGETLTEKFTVTTIDGTKAEIVVTINGTNDDPKLSGELTGTVTEDGTKTANGQLNVSDVDASDTHTYSVVGASTGTYGSFAVDSNGKWTYTLDNDAAQALKSGDIKTETYTVQVSDGHGGFDTKTVTVTINGADDGAIVTPSKPGDDLGSVTEDSVLTTGGKLDVTDPDAGQAKFNAVSDQAGDYGKFSIDANGNWTYSLNNADTKVQALAVGETLTEKFTVTTLDGTKAEIVVTINGTNDDPKLSGELTGTVTEDGTKTANGQLSVSDIDASDTHTYSVVGPATGTYGSFAVDANGKWTYTLDNDAAQALKSGDIKTETYTVQVSDGHGGFDTKTVTVTINGADDGAVVTPSKPGDDAGSVTEDTLLTTGGKLDVTDPDAGQAKFNTVTDQAGDHGKFSIDANGNWTYSLNNADSKVQALAVGETLTEKFTVTTIDGTKAEIVVTINGTNDDPKLSGELTGTVTEDGVKTANGQLAVSDVDTSDTHSYAVVGASTGTYGSFAVDSNGKWTYTLDNDAAQALKSGDIKTETYTVQVSDGHGGFDTKTITVTINGADDGAVVTPSKPGDDAGSVTEDTLLTTGGKLDVTDPDAGQAKFNTVTDQAGDHGKFSIDANGNWTYSLNNADSKVQALAVGETLTEKFTVTTIDGTKAEIVVTINGTNDDPKLSGELTGTVTEDGTKTANGQLSVADVDASDTHTYSVVGAATGTYGSFAVDANGKWTYTLDNDAAQALKSGDVKTETYTVQVSDGHGGFDTKTVTVTINGADDGAIVTPSKPGDDAGSVTEDTLLTTGGKLDVTDPDAGQAKFNTVTDQAGDHGKFSIDANGNWTYSLNNADTRVQALAVGETLTEKFTVTTIDGTKAEIVVTINGTNDDPKLSGELTGTVTEDGVKTANGQLSVADVDASDTHTYSVVGAATGTYGSFAVDGNGKWTYTLDNDAAQALKSGDVKTETYTVQVSDGHGGFDTKTVTVTINGADDGAVVTPSKPGDDLGSVTEDSVLTTGGKLDVTDPDDGQAKFNTVTDQAGDHGKFSIDANGNWTYSLNNADTRVQALAVGETLTEKFTVTTIDGTKAEIVVTINGTNDDPKLSGELTGTVTEDGVKTANGQLSVADVDASDTHTYSAVGPATGTYGSFTVDANGKWTYTLDNDAAQALKSGDIKTETYTVQVSDGHGGFDTKTVTVTINGADDGAVVTPSKPGDDAGSVTEDTLLTTGGKLDVTDPDAGQAKFNSVTDQAGDHGKFSIDANGNWTYSLNNADTKVQALAVGETLTEKFTVTTIDGTKAEIVVTINGTNDDPKLSGELTGTVTEDGVKTANGQLSVADVDASDTHTYSVVGASTGTYGSFAVDANGKWTYTLDNDAAQALKSGEIKTETYTVQVSDGHGGFDTKTVTVTINGADDGAVVTPSKPGDDAGSVTEDSVLTTGGKLDVTDPDAGQAKFNTVTDQAGDHGKFSIDANGNWTYSLNNADTKVQALAVGETLTEKFTVTTIDGTKAEIVVTINGTNDDPKLSGELTGTVTEDGVKTANGQLAVSDVDTSDTHSYAVVGASTGTYGSFAVNSNGKWTYTLDNDAAQALKSGDVKTETYTVQVSDGHGGFDTKTVTVTINGADDGAVVTPSKPGDDLGSVTEDSVLTTGGKLDVTDPDAGQAKFNTVTDQAGDHGKFSIDANGNWTYSLNNADSKVQALAVGETLTEKFTVTTIDGTKAEIVVTINGTNDDPELSGELTGTVTEDGTKTANGQLSVADVDASDTHTYSVVGPATGTYGSFAVDGNGKWTYTLDNDEAQALKSGDVKTETYTVQVSDGHGGFDTKTVTVTINGADDGAVVMPSKPGDDLGSVTEDTVLTTGGKLDVTDPDAGQAKFNTVTDQAGDHGKFSIDANGNWTYSLNNADTKVQALAVGETLTEKFTVTTIDGTKAEIVVTINGTNDDPKLSGELTGTVTEDGTKTANGQLSVADVDASDTHTYSVVGAATGTYGSFAVDANGKWTYTLDNDAAQALKSGDVKTETYTVQVSDGHGGFDTKTVTVTINGADDGAVVTPSKPGDDLGSVTEDTLLTTGGKLDVTDPDAGQAKFNTVTDQAGDHGKFSIDANGNWTYSLNNADTKVQALAVGETLTEKFTVTTLDGTKAEIVVTIHGTNDAPTISGASTGAVTEDAAQSSISGQLTKADVDATDTHTWSVNNDGKGTYGTFAVDSTGKWTYNLDNSSTKVQALAAGQTVTDTITVTVDDGHGGKATQVVTITVTGTNDAPTISGAATGAVTEDAAQSSISGQLTKADVDATDTHTWSVNNDGKGTYGTFAVDSTGKWTYNLDNSSTKVQALAAGQTVTDTITVTVDDGHGGKATQVVTITVTGTNDAPTISGAATGAVTEDAAQSSISGQLSKTDIDATDTHTWSVNNDGKGTYGTFAVDSTGKWTYNLDNTSAKVQALAAGQTVTDTITVTVDDGHGGKATQVVTITVTGTNDAPTISGAATGSVTEDAAQSSISGQLTKTDVDATDTHTWSVNNDGKGTYGTFAVDSTGKWTYNLDNSSTKVQALAAGQTVTDTITVTVDDGHGGKATQVVTITVTGTNDAPTISGAATGSVTEDAAQSSISGQLSKTDVDATDTHTWSVNNDGKGTYGTFAVDSTGKWTYNLDNSSAKVQALAAGQTVTDTITVTVDDGHGGKATQVVTITVTGTNDAPTISGAATGAVTEDAAQSSVSGQLSKTDIDTTDTHTWSVNNDGKGTYGTFAVDSTGKWTYNLDNSSAKVQALAAGQTVTDTITVTVDDGHGGTATQVVTITVTGTNDAPTIGGVTTGAVKEDGTQIISGQLTKTDVDATDTHTWTANNAGKGTYGTLTVDNTGKWTYTLDNANAKVQALADGQTVNDVITVTVDDGHGGTAQQVVTITVTGTNDAPTIGGVISGGVTEDGTQVVSGLLTKTDVDATDTHTWTLNNAGKGVYGTFVVDGNGKWTYTLDNANAKVQALADGQKVTDTITVTINDGHGGTAQQVITVTVTGSNDVPTISGAATGAVTEDAAQSSVSGQLSKTDIDTTDTHTWSVNNDGKGTYGTFAVDSTGKWTYNLDNTSTKVQALAAGQTVTDTITVTVDDGHGGKATQVVTITVTGTNDAPTIGGVTTGAVKEDGTQIISGQLTKTDVDATDTHTWTVNNAGKGTYGTLTVDNTGKWTYTLDNANAKVQALADGQTVNDVITVTVDDGHGGTAQQVVTITVTGTNDAPTIGGVISGGVTEDGTQIVSGQLTKTDVDATDTHTWTLNNAGKGVYGSFVVDGNGKWTYTLDNANAKVQALADGQKVTDTITVTINDGHGGTAQQVITVTVTGSNDAPTISGAATGAVTEDAAQSSVSGQLSKTDIDTTDTHTWSVNNDGKGTYGTFSVDSTGKWTYNLDNSSAKVQALAAGQTVNDTITVTVDDGHGGTATQVVTVTITGSNDAPTIGGVATGAVKEDGTQVITGQLTKTDVDATDTHTWSVSNNGKGTYGTLTVDNTGKWTYTLDNANAKVQALADGQTVTDTVTVTVDDGRGGTAQQVVTITVTGTNDAPTIGGVISGGVTEDGTQVVSGLLTKTDVDATDTHTWTLNNAGKGVYGSFVVDGAGKWTYTLDNANAKVQALADGQKVTDTITVTINDGHGGTATQVITVTVTGSNDAPTMAGTTSGAVKEDGTLTATGQLTKTDVDTTDTHTWSVSNNGVGTYGTFTVDSSGKWIYTLNNTSANVQGLKEGQQVTDTITVTVNDGHGGTAQLPVTVTITGTNDAPVITGQTSGTVTEDYTLSTTGKLTVVDADVGQSGVIAQTNVVGKYGTFSIDANGNWTYTLNNSLAVVQNLPAGALLSESFNVVAGDGTTVQPISVSIIGTNDAPVAADNSANVEIGTSHVFTVAEFNFSDGAEGNALQSVIISRLPTDGTLTLNGSPVSLNTAVSAADIAAGKLVFTPSANGLDTSIGFQVRDSGGTDHGGQNTSGTYNFVLNTDNIVTGENVGSGTGITPVLNGGSGDDVILGDKGGTVVTVEPGKNYNIALVVDTSGSMAWGLDGSSGVSYANSRMKLVKDALVNLANQLVGHDGTVNVTLIGFATSAGTPVTLQNLTSSNVQTLLTAINNLSATGGTNYEAAFNSAVSWFNSQTAAGKSVAAGYENVTFFLTDGDPTYYIKSNGSTGGDGSTTDQTTVQESVNAFAPLSGVSTVHGIGIGNGVNEDYLRLFDNTGNAGGAVTTYASFGSGSDTTIANFNSSSGWGNVGNWTVSGTSNGGSVSRVNSDYIRIVDTNGGTSTNAITPTFSYTGYGKMSFSVATANFTSGDVFTWSLQVQKADGSWMTIDKGSLTSAQSNWATITTNTYASGTYRFVFDVADNTSSGGSTTVYIDDITRTMYSASNVIAAPGGDVDIVLKGSDLAAALQGGSSSTDPAVVGNDVINGGAGNDIIFGDTINTDHLAWGTVAAGSHDGQGLKALQDFLAYQNGHAATSNEVYDYLKANHAQFNLPDDPRGGNDTIHGGTGDDIIYGQGGNDTLYGDDGNDVIYGGSGDDYLHGGAGNDVLDGGSGNDTLIGGKGDDTLYGGAGSDTFKWELNDQGSVGAPSVDTIKDFSTATVANGGDVLDLKDLLIGEKDGTLTQYLNIHKEGNNTVIDINTKGQIAQGADQKIVLENVDLTNNGALSNQAIINDLLQKGKLNVDHS